MLLIGVVIRVILFLVIKAVPIALMMAKFLTGIYDFFSEAINWVVELLVSIYEWISTVIEELLDGMKRILDFIKHFPDETKEMFDDLIDLL
jgi:phage-related protein